MKFISIILLLFLSIGIFGKASFIAFIKKIKSPIELSASAEADDESKEADDNTSKEKDSEEDTEDKNNFYVHTESELPHVTLFSCNKHLISFYKTLFKSHFKEVATPPPPELV